VTGGVADVAVSKNAAPRGPLRIRPSVVLTKSEAFAACQVLADADRCLVRAGLLGEADALCDLFELLEARMAAVDR
jgi:hypothetical protein